MKFTLSWLKNYLDTSASLAEITEALNGIGLEVEEVVDRAAPLAPFTVAYVKEAVKHPNADKLRLCQVESAHGLLQVVCGAPNARAGIKVILAVPGAVIPASGETLEKGVIRGQESQGMMCSERELLISEEHNGIIEVDEKWPVGTAAAQALGLDDPMIYIKVTANRPDALGVYGVARDLAAKGLGQLKPLPVPQIAGSFVSPLKISLNLGERPELCPHYVGYYIRGVKNGPSPQWLQKLLLAIGLRPISAVVDITNYITFALGRPLHAFDADKVKGHIQVRLAHEGEELAALNGKSYQLTGDMVVIADDEKAEALGGIIGGEASGCTEETRNVFLECAAFNPSNIAATGRKLGIITDARYRLERGVDPAITVMGATLGAEMIRELCGGEISELVAAGSAGLVKRKVDLRKNRVLTLGGVDIPLAEQIRILTALGFTVKDDGALLQCEIPSWRPDVQGEADLVEEICRIHGLEKIPYAAMPRPDAVARPVLTPLQKRVFATRRHLAARGFHEAVTWSFLSEAQAKLFGGGQAELILDNPISVELSTMRPSLLPNLLAAISRNVKRGFSDLMLAEVGQVYAGDRPEQETIRAAAVRRGKLAPRNWQGEARSIDLYDAKGDALAILEAAGAPIASLQIVAGGPEWFHPGRSGTIQMGPQNKLGFFGEIHPRILAAFDVKGPVVACEVNLSAIPPAKAKVTARSALNASDLMPVSRDFAFVVASGVEADKLVKAAKSADKNLITDVSVFDVFPLEDGRISYALEVTLQPRQATLTEAEISGISEKIIASVAKATGASLRG